MSSEVEALKDRIRELEEQVDKLTYEKESLEDDVFDRDEKIHDLSGSAPLARAIAAFAEWQQEGYVAQSWSEKSRAAITSALWSEVSDYVTAITGKRPELPSSVPHGS